EARKREGRRKRQRSLKGRQPRRGRKAQAGEPEFCQCLLPVSLAVTLALVPRCPPPRPDASDSGRAGTNGVEFASERDVPLSSDSEIRRANGGRKARKRALISMGVLTALPAVRSFRPVHQPALLPGPGARARGPR